MKRLGKIVVCLAGGLALYASARANDVLLANNPYAPIVVRNVFGLNPPLGVETNAPPADLPKITPNGIMSILGRLQVLYKVSEPARAGQPAKDESYILSEGQRQDDIEVIEIDEKNSLVTFNNHGSVQELPLVKASAATASLSTPSQGRPMPNLNNGEPGGRIPNRFGGRPINNPVGNPGSARNRLTGGGLGGGPTPATVAPGAGYNSMMGGSSASSVQPGAGLSGQPGQQGQVTPEQVAAWIELQRAEYERENNPVGRLLPPTSLTPH